MTRDQENINYLHYLEQRSKLAFFYRMKVLYPKINRFLGVKPLDIGCGIGDMLTYRNDVVGADINDKIVEYCKKKNLNVHQMTPEVLPFDDNSFDSAVLDNVLEHIIDPSTLLSEIGRVLTKGANFVVGVPGPKGYDADPDHKKYYDIGKLVDVLEPFGFQLEEKFYAPINLKLLGAYMSQHCLYAVFKNNR